MMSSTKPDYIIQRSKKSGSVDTAGIKGPALNKSFQDPPIHFSALDSPAKIQQILEGSRAVTHLDNRLNGL